VYTKSFLLLTLVNFLAFAVLNAYNLLPLYIQALGGREAEIGRIMAVYQFAAILCQAATAGLLDRWPRRPVLLASMAALTAASFAFALTTRLGWHFYLFRFTQGAALALSSTIGLALIGGLAPPGRRAEAVGLYGVAGLAALALAPAAGESVLHAWGFHALFLATGLLGIGALLLCTVIPLPPADVRPKGPSLRLRGWLPLLPVLQPAFQFGLANAILFVFLPPFGRDVGLPRVGLFYLVYTAAAIAVRVAGGRLADRLGRRQIILPSLAGQTLGLVLCIGLESSAAVLVLVGLLNGAAQGFLFPATSAMAFELAPGGRRTQALAVFNMAVLLGGVIGATGFGWLAEVLGYRPSFALIGAVLGAGTLVFWWSSRATGVSPGRPTTVTTAEHATARSPAPSPDGDR
jgi:MFS family permease